jgi:Spy/CpxP family protein refolding chaperone
MKKIVLVASLFIFAFMVSAQQGGQRRGPMSEEQMKQRYEELTKELTLKPAQLDSIKKFDQEFFAKQRVAREKAGDDREKMRDEFTKLRNQQTEKIKSVLTAEQFKKYQAYQEKLRERRGGGGGGN